MLGSLKTKILPSAPRFKSLIGPSFILLGLGLGSGELILWPYLTSNWGLGIVWGAVLGVTFQFFMNMEIERYSLARGESVFVGFTRLFKYFPIWFIASTFFAWIWPGIIATSARIFAEVFGFSNPNLAGIIFLILIGIILSLGTIVYKTVEKLALILIVVSVPLIFGLTFYLTNTNDLMELARGIVNLGFVPESLPLASFLAAFAFSGAGGNLNLAQSFYIKEKGYAMGRYSGKITSLLSGKSENMRLEGAKFEITDENLAKFKSWWRLTNLEHFLIFWIGGVVTILLLALLAYSTAYGLVTPGNGVDFIIFEAGVIATRIGVFVGTSFLIIAGLMLFNTQLTVLDATSRIMSENLLILKKDRWEDKILPKIYYSFLWAQIFFGIIIFLFNFGQPLLLLTISAVLNAVAMFIHIGLTLFLNIKTLDKEIRPSYVRIFAMLSAFIFFGYFSFKTIASAFFG